MQLRSVPSSPPVDENVHWAHYYLFGFLGREQLDLRDYCTTSSVASVRFASDPLTLLVSFATLGIYVPRSVTVTCIGINPA
ncbi:MAG TPA: hypothetical protein VIV60_29505 [Polyangiaceae bacterium]